MGKTVEDICSLIVEKSGQKTGLASPIEHKVKSLTSFLGMQNPAKTLFLYDYDGLYNPEERIIAQKLAQAIDENSPSKIKMLKKEYGKLKEFSDAKKFLNQKCKEVWNVYEPIKNPPKNAMKALGITNEPDLDFLLKNSVKYYEKDNSNTTSYIISSILNNDNLSYTINEIHSYLKNMHKKEGCKYNFKTTQYLISKLNYNKSKLNELGIDDNTISKALENSPVKIRIKFNLDNISRNLKFINK